MKVFYCTTFEGVWPVGTAALIVAENTDDARILLKNKLKSIGLDLKSDNALVEVDASEPKAIVLCNGDY